MYKGPGYILKEKKERVLESSEREEGSAEASRVGLVGMRTGVHPKWDAKPLQGFKLRSSGI